MKYSLAIDYIRYCSRVFLSVYLTYHSGANTDASPYRSRRSEVFAMTDYENESEGEGCAPRGIQQEGQGSTGSASRTFRPGDAMRSAGNSQFQDDDPLADGRPAAEGQADEAMDAIDGEGSEAGLPLDEFLEFMKRQAAQDTIVEWIDEARRFLAVPGMDPAVPLTLLELHGLVSDRIRAVLHLLSASGVDPLDVWLTGKQKYLQDERDAGLREPSVGQAPPAS